MLSGNTSITLTIQSASVPLVETTSNTLGTTVSRHNLADLTKIRQSLGYEPRWRMADGLKQFLGWAGEAEPAPLRYRESLDEMKKAGLFHTSR